MYNCIDLKGKLEDNFIIKFFHNEINYERAVTILKPKDTLLSYFMPPVADHSPNTNKRIRIRHHAVPPFIIMRNPDSLFFLAFVTGTETFTTLQVWVFSSPLVHACTLFFVYYTIVHVLHVAVCPEVAL